jgi:hypothetical protein
MNFISFYDLTEDQFVNEFKEELPDKFFEEYLRKRHRYFNGQESWFNVNQAFFKTKQCQEQRPNLYQKYVLQAAN